jgi:hypothetical protein
MINDSVPWREELIAIASRLRRRGSQKRWTDRTYFLVERDIMFAAYSIRKLNEAGKLSTNLPKKRFSVQVFNLSGRIPSNILDRYSPEKFYDLEKGASGEVDLVTLYNQVIHSFMFTLILFEDGTTTLLVASDRASKSHLYGVAVGTLCDLFEYIGIEDIVGTSFSIIDGEQYWVRTSNHDLEETGQASGTHPSTDAETTGEDSTQTEGAQPEGHAPSVID